MLPLLRSLSLRQLLTLPYVLVVLTVTLVIGGLSYNAGRHAVDELSGQLLRETTARIAAATKTHIAGAKCVLEAFVCPESCGHKKAPFAAGLNHWR